MTNLNRCRVSLTGAAGLPGVATHYFDVSVADSTAIRTFWNVVKTYLPSVVTIQVANSGDTIDPATGKIVSGWSGPAQAPISAIGSGSYLSTAGAAVEWIVPTPVNGRRPLGKTFVVPMVTSSFDSSGTITDTTVTALQAAGLALVQTLGGGGALAVWHRPKGGTGGLDLRATNCRVPDKQVVLRSRRA